ncbi:MAG TPA: hypothetical protein VMY06_14395, partial [Sedimentisphaerales bacterium]|nr:hypothetical protein [Sedimentisphaerales bacterium]
MTELLPAIGTEDLAAAFEEDAEFGDISCAADVQGRLQVGDKLVGFAALPDEVSLVIGEKPTGGIFGVIPGHRRQVQ